MKILVCSLTLLIFAFSGYSQSRHSRVKIYLDGKDLKELSEAGLAVDHGEYKKGVFFISDFSDKEIDIIKNKGYRYEIQIEDVSEHYVKQNTEAAQGEAPKKKRSAGCSAAAKNIKTPANFSLGSMGGFYTYQEMLDQLDSMFAKYPDLISARQPINADTTLEGRPLYWLRISDNPNIDEAEPEVLYTALHHAREPASMHQLITYMWHLLENYSDPEIKGIVDNIEMYFVPCINPDGYVYNETTNPNGGGMWRKNRKGGYGVDLNRNYGYYWGYDDAGSSPDLNAQTYRGDSAFSEAETKIIKSFCNAHDFKLALNYHTYGNLLIYPWGYEQSIYTPDSALFHDYATLLTTDNSYTYGTGDQTVGYVVNGDSDDWMYGEQGEKAKIISMTPEAGMSSEGFWPPSSRIETICVENITQNLYTAKLAGKYALLKEQSSPVVTDSSGSFSYLIKRMGLDSGVFNVTAASLSTGLIVPAYSKTFDSLAVMQSAVDSIPFSIAAGTSENTVLQFTITVSNGIYAYTDTISKIYSGSNYVYYNDANSLTNFTTTTWNVTGVDYYSPAYSITDSPSGNYQNSKNTSVTLKDTFDLTYANFAFLSFMAKWDIEANYDYAQVMASTDGINWQPLCGKYTHPGNSDQDYDEPLYDGVQLSWVEELVDLSAYLGQKVYLRFRLVSDVYVTGDGFYFDDIKVTTNTGPTPGTGVNSENTRMIVLQNTPNPVREKTYINYQLPQDITSGKIIFYSSVGIPVKEVEITKSSGSVAVNCSGLSSGVYFYHIESNSFVSPAKKMVVVK